VLEDLNVHGMIGNRSLARAISDAAWYELRRMLQYKCVWYGRDLVVVDRWLPSSKTCSTCGYLIDRLTLSVRDWRCQGCGTWHDRDVNAAKNWNLRSEGRGGRQA
jgi:putative transposase